MKLPVRSSSKAWWLLGAAVLAGVIAAIVWISPWRAPAPAYQTAPLRYGDITEAVSANGTLNPVTVVNVGTQVSGTVQAIYVDFNSRVKAGEVLLRLDPTLFKAQVAQSRAAVQSAEANLFLAQANESRGRSMQKSGYVTKADLDQLVASRKAAEAQVAVAKAQLQHDEANLSYTVIRSPIDGAIINRVVDVGQTVAASFQTPTLFQIGQNLKKMQIDATVDEADIGQIRTGERAQFTVDAFPDQHFAGKVTQVRLNPTVVQNVVTYDVVIQVANPEEKLLPGMTAYVDIIVTEHRHVLTVPNAALRVALGQGSGTAKAQGPGQGVIYVLEDGKPRAVTVRTGISDSRNTEVSAAGLQPGDEVVVAAGTGRTNNARSHSMFRVRP